MLALRQGERPQETNPASTLISNYEIQHPRIQIMRKQNFCCLSHPIWETLLWQPKQTKTGAVAVTSVAQWINPRPRKLKSLAQGHQRVGPQPRCVRLQRPHSLLSHWAASKRHRTTLLNATFCVWGSTWHIHARQWQDGMMEKRKERYKQAERRVQRRSPSLDGSSLETEVLQPLLLGGMELHHNNSPSDLGLVGWPHFRVFSAAWGINLPSLLQLCRCEWGPGGLTPVACF